MVSKEILSFLEILPEPQQSGLFDLLREQSNIFSPFKLNKDFNLHSIASDPDVQFYDKHCHAIINYASLLWLLSKTI